MSGRVVRATQRLTCPAPLALSAEPLSSSEFDSDLVFGLGFGLARRRSNRYYRYLPKLPGYELSVTNRSSSCLDTRSDFPMRTAGN